MRVDCQKDETGVRSGPAQGQGAHSTSSRSVREPFGITANALLLCFHREHVLWTETDSDHPCRDSAQQWKFFQQPRGQGRRHLLGCFEDALKQMLMNKNLRTLCEVGGPLAAVLNRAQVI